MSERIYKLMPVFAIVNLLFVITYTGNDWKGIVSGAIAGLLVVGSERK